MVRLPRVLSCFVQSAVRKYATSSSTLVVDLRLPVNVVLVPLQVGHASEVFFA
jgi:hypothetical protein